MNPITVCCAAVLMLGLAACGSDDDDGGTAMMMETPTTVAVDLSGVAAGATAGMVAIPAGESRTIGDITFACAAGGAACSVTVAADGNATATGGMVTAANSAAYTERATAASETKRTAMMMEAGQETDAGLGGDVEGTPVDTYSLAVSRTSTATTITITDTANAGDDDPKFAQAADMMDGRTMHVRDNGMGEEEVVIVYTDIAAPTPVAFATWEDPQGMRTQALNTRLDGETAMPDDSLTIPESGNEAVLPLIMAASFASPPEGSSSVEHTFLHGLEDADPDTAGNQPRAAAAVDGTYRGAEGTYTCSGSSPCMVTVDDAGKVTGVSAGWVFTPDTGATSDQPDNDYLRYGFWLKRTTASGGAVTYNEVETFAYGSAGNLPSGNVTEVKDSARYQGNAVGVYAMRRGYDADTGALVDATAGHFKARASLEATFGQVQMDGEGNIAPILLNTLTGTIDRFELSGGEENAWAVHLNGDITASDGTVSNGVASDAAENGADGSFSATFHGSVEPVGEEIPQPGSVVGEFNADFRDGRVAGAFGATKRPESE